MRGDDPGSRQKKTASPPTQVPHESKDARGEPISRREGPQRERLPRETTRTETETPKSLGQTGGPRVPGLGEEAGGGDAGANRRSRRPRCGRSRRTSLVG
jgi:hypothetical protein